MKRKKTTFRVIFHLNDITDRVPELCDVIRHARSTISPYTFLSGIEELSTRVPELLDLQKVSS